MRLNQFLAHGGLGSRRSVERLVADGKVAVNGKPAQTPALTVDPEKDRVTVEGRPVHLPARHVYLMLHKPRGYDVTRTDPHQKKTVYELLPKGTHPAVQAVGRLDRETTGLLLFTDDGELAQRLTHPRYGCVKTYEAAVEGPVETATLTRLREGIELDDGPARVLDVRRIAATRRAKPGSGAKVAAAGGEKLRLTIAEGRKHIVRRLLEAAGHPVRRLHRSAVGPVRMQGLGLGRVRRLEPAEIEALKAIGTSP